MYIFSWHKPGKPGGAMRPSMNSSHPHRDFLRGQRMQQSPHPAPHALSVGPGRKGEKLTGRLNRKS